MRDGYTSTGEVWKKLHGSVFRVTQEVHGRATALMSVSVLFRLYPGNTWTARDL